MIQQTNTTKEEQIDIYMSLPKETLAEMLYECNKTIENFLNTSSTIHDNYFSEIQPTTE